MRIGIDIGGTFTDVVCVEEDGTITVRKFSSSVDDYSRSIVEELPGVFEERNLGGEDVRELVHGTTVATNAVLEQAGARTGLITTKGFRDVLELRRIRMPELYNWDWDKPPDLVERRFRKEVNERIDAKGTVLVALDREEASRVVDDLVSLGMESIAVCLINSCWNPEHEQMIGDDIRSRHPEVSVSISCDIMREIREYERTATTVVNAYIRPLIQHYVSALSSSLQAIEVRAPLFIMQSNGGVMTAEACCERPVFMIESGPAAGVIAGHALALSEGIANLITFDMGGTTAKASIVEGGALNSALEYEVGSSLSLISRLIKGGGHLIRIPSIDIAEVGAGGGSIAWLDTGNALRIGPVSAGASPGPACYCQGGLEATITDANLVLGYINPAGLVGGGLKLDRQRAEQVVQERLGEALGLSLLETAYGIHEIGNSNMMRAIRAVSTERGRDLREFALLAFGGSGPVHAFGLARSLEMKEVIVPPHPGLFSAFGLISANIEHYGIQTIFEKTTEADLDLLGAMLREMEGASRETLLGQGFEEESVQVRRWVDIRYAGQAYELSLEIPEGPLTEDSLRRLEQLFDEEHERTYGHRGGADEEYVLVNFRVIGTVLREPVQVAPLGHAGEPKSRETRQVYFGREVGLLEAPVLERRQLTRDPVQGPLLIDEFDSTTVVTPDSRAWLDSSGNIRILIED